MPGFELSLSFSQLLLLALDLLALLLCITSSPSLPLLCENLLCVHADRPLTVLILSGCSFCWQLFSPSGLSFWCTCLTAEHGKLKKPSTQKKHFLTTIQASVCYQYSSPSKDKTQHCTKKTNSILAEKVSRWKFPACSLRLQQIQLVVLIN